MALRGKGPVMSAIPSGSIASQNPFSAFANEDSSEDEHYAVSDVTGAPAAMVVTGQQQSPPPEQPMRPQQRQKLRKQQNQAHNVLPVDDHPPRDPYNQQIRGDGSRTQTQDNMKPAYYNNYDASPDNYQGGGRPRRDRNYQNYQNDTTGRDEQAYGSGEELSRGVNRSPRGRGVGRGRGRGRGGDRGGGGGAREFDRHVSGTDRPRGMKRDGRGQYNWGHGGDDPQTHETTAAANPEPQGDWGTFDFGSPAAAQEAAAGEGSPSAEGDNQQTNADGNNQQTTDELRNEEPEMQSYEVYLRQQAVKRAIMLERMPAVSNDLRNGMQQSLQELEKDGYKQHVKKDTGETNKRREDRNYRRLPDQRAVEVTTDYGGGPRRTAYGERSARGRDKPVVEKQPTRSRKVSNLNLQDSGAFPSLPE
eukprot:Lankesteria_metandrocarpae@DN1408_c0_g1_i1.p1